ncbi:hypothetical protein [Aestuariispira insulae]|uniref:Uncharacterized protein n=1 Tax=Aestuariispira insulae TaxID=1461337 RepID=A0A3D9HNT0_9PROT|nr:hypothetical protein [Aestuariispira insulae]RED51065.1 hypothetical protein DFP90_104343 [Aestuariispira insulae]
MIDFENKLTIGSNGPSSGDISLTENRSDLDSQDQGANLPSDGRRYSGFRFFAGLILAISVSLAVWVGVIYLYSLLIKL